MASVNVSFGEAAALVFPIVVSVPGPGTVSVLAHQASLCKVGVSGMVLNSLALAGVTSAPQLNPQPTVLVSAKNTENAQLRAQMASMQEKLMRRSL
jgi:hypothetical protein